MAGTDEKGKPNDLDLDVKKTGPTITSDKAGELADGDLNNVAGGLKPNRTITDPVLCGSTGCEDGTA
jgi:hypothetical protein